MNERFMKDSFQCLVQRFLSSELLGSNKQLMRHYLLFLMLHYSFVASDAQNLGLLFSVLLLA